MTLVRALTSWLLLPVLLPELFGHPTIEGLAAFLEQRQFLTRRGAQDFREHLVPLGGSGSQKLFGFAPGSGSCYRYYEMARRLELFHFTGEEYRKNAEEFLSAVDPRYLALTDREAAIRRVECYDRYMDSRLEDRRVACPIRLIQAESSGLQSPFRITQEGWSELTSDFRIVPGSGRHLEMLDEPHVAKNATLVQAMLEEIARSAAAQPVLVGI